MFLTILDLVLILIIFCFIAYGFALGLIQAIGSLVGLFLGAWIAGMYYQPVGDWLSPFILNNQKAAYVVAFILVFIIVSKIVGLIFLLIEKVFHIISIIPFLKTINRLAGGLLGLAEGVLFLGLGLYVANQFFQSGRIHELIQESQVAALLLIAAKLLVPLIPKLIEQAKSFILDKIQ